MALIELKQKIQNETEQPANAVPEKHIKLFQSCKGRTDCDTLPLP
jgi:hypothetical protein